MSLEGNYILRLKVIGRKRSEGDSEETGLMKKV